MHDAVMKLCTTISEVDANDGEIAELITINFKKLLNGDLRQSAQLLSACAEAGFCYLNLEDWKGNAYLDNVDSLLKVSKAYFAQPLEVKKKDTNEEISLFNICGYKPMGLDTGNVKNAKDGCEGMRVPVDLHFNPAGNPHLRPIAGMKPYWGSLTSFIEDSHFISTTILASLSTSLHLPDASRFENAHQAFKSSKTTAVMQCYPLDNLPPGTSVGHFTHTDTGSITILFNTDWGLQVYNTPLARWEYVPPRPGHGIINVGDALKFLSHQKLKSSLHRVVPWHGKWVVSPRFALIFFLRPNNDAVFVDTEGNTWTADQWLDLKFGNYRSSHEVQKKSAIATGKKGFVGLWETVTEVGADE